MNNILIKLRDVGMSTGHILAVHRYSLNWPMRSPQYAGERQGGIWKSRTPKGASRSWGPERLLRPKGGIQHPNAALQLTVHVAQRIARALAE